ncbi:MFS transporter [Paenibacillus sp.]|jgi:DHA1 family putative efflux transporter-like MFS transporter|uniref:MFS transporter n=1 Tax=Paenibacillus sp. TaxID=58172 RepID=UPI002823E9C5|nr:MFS transporter [Paenibacillus sp.]MDR0266555.1 MFS transporter [Paenibacillus sp.]
MNRVGIYLLALGAFIIGTVDFVTVGILNMIAVDMHVSVGVAGQLVTIFSFSFVIGSLVLVALTIRFERKKVLLYSLAVFLAGNITAFLSTQFEILMVSRVLLAASGGLFTVIATAFAAKLASPGKQGAAIATVTTGFSAALVLGVPIGMLLTSYMDWHFIFLSVGAITILLIIMLAWIIPTAPGQTPIPLKEQLLIIKDKRVFSGLLTTLFWIIGYTIVFTYISPLLQAIGHFSVEMISTTLLVLGIFAFIGSRFGGYASDKWGTGVTIRSSLILHALALISLPLTSGTTWGAMVTIMIWGMSSWTTTTANQIYLISLKPSASEIILSYQTAVLNIGISLGAATGGMLVEHVPIFHLGWISSAMVLIAFVTASYSFLLSRRAKNQMGKLDLCNEIK